jgi:hypothetical protein
MLNREQQLHDKARRCRELAETAMTEEGRSILCEIAQRYEVEASAAGISPKPEPVPEASA